MASCHVRRYTTASGEARYAVRYRTGGRSSPTKHAGSFASRIDAEIRRLEVLEALRAGRRPRRRIVAPSATVPTSAELRTAFEAGFAAGWTRGLAMRGRVEDEP